MSDVNLTRTQQELRVFLKERGIRSRVAATASTVKITATVAGERIVARWRYDLVAEITFGGRKVKTLKALRAEIMAVFE